MRSVLPQTMCAGVLASISIALAPAAFANEFSPRLDGTWKVIAAKFPAASHANKADAKGYVGAHVEKHKRYFESPFAIYNICGMNIATRAMALAELIKERPQLASLKLPGKQVAVSKYECKGHPEPELEFISLDNNRTAYVPWKGVYYELAFVSADTPRAKKFYEDPEEQKK